MSFEDIEFKDNFDGIWACASVLHVPENNISTVLSKFTDALKNNGILYTSFKYGDKEQIRNGRFFADYTEERLINCSQQNQNWSLFNTGKPVI